MAYDSPLHPSISKEIERSESYLVCCMFEEAALLAHSVLKQLCQNKSMKCADTQSHELIESAGMVLVQSWNKLGRASKMLDRLQEFFDAVTDIPVSVLLAGVCFQLTEGDISGVREFLEVFLSKWRCVDEQNYVPVDREADLRLMEKPDGNFVLGGERYSEVAEFYITFLANYLNDIELAYSWIEKAELHEDTRQFLLRRLDSLRSSKADSSAECGIPTLLSDEHKVSAASVNESCITETALRCSKDQYPSGGCNNRKQAALKLLRRFYPNFWWFPSNTLKHGSTRLVISNRKIVVGFIIFIIYYTIRKKRATLKRLAMGQVTPMKKAISDVWQLAFSYQVNPLAAIQSPPAMTRASR